ncbi:MAG TPA: aminomethyl-transferring glycine dehydrogenase subunit GcvPA [Thermoanaerobaculia bacterium]|nr:aminomethyl-transferring glycine dehydrogenase subunit GcvPA [Thermoanaerobaculia bacterium]
MSESIRTDRQAEDSMRYIPNASQDVEEMLKVIGIDSIDKLFETIPDPVKLKRLLDIPGPWSEIEVRKWFRSVAAKNDSAVGKISFLGAGAYTHYQPACVDQLLLRGEFLTSYTPYQPEVSQGTLQAIFEYQTHQCLLTGLDVANASLYDGSTAFVEGVLLASRMVKGRNKVVVARSIHPEYLDTLQTYVQNLGIEIVEVDWSANGQIDPEALRSACDENTFAVAVQSPNFLGVLEDYGSVATIADAVHAAKIAVITEATSLGVISPPGEHGFDIALGEGQAWGIAPQYGGPYLGFMAVRDALKRFMPGRLVGETVDADGTRAFVLTLATREQHIRRGKATSNICTNEALIALAANIYLSLMGRDGLEEVATQSLQKAAYLRKRLSEIPGVELPFGGPVYNEFTVRTSLPSAQVIAAMSTSGILAGIPLETWYEAQPNDFLVAVTELHSREQLDHYVDAIGAVLKGDAR